MNAPATSAIDTPEFITVPIGNLYPSPTNPRSRRGFDEASLTELAATMAPPVGIIEPLVVRAYNPMHGNPPSGKSFADMQGYYEIVCGERRWRAAQIAKLTSIPALVRTLTGFEVLRLQLIENEKRKDLDALEEAEGYEKLMQQKDADGNHYTAETIAKLQGVSKGTIYGRRKLLALCPDARQAFYEGKLDASTALLIARIPVEKLQLQALKELTTEAGWGNQFVETGDKMSFRRARAFIQDKFMLDLERAVFDPADAELLPKAGSCTACPQRTGNARDLFDDVDDDNICTDTVCFAMKKTAHVLKLQKQAENEGAAVIKGKEAKKLIPNNYNPKEQLRDHGYATLDTPIPGDAKKRTLGQVLEENELLTQQVGKATVQKTIVANPHRDGQMIETVNIEQAAKALREMGYELTLKSQAQGQQSPQDQDKKREKEKQELAIENTWRARLFNTLHEQIEADMLDPNSGTFPKLYRMLAIQMWQDNDYCDTEDTVALMRKYTTLPDEQEGIEIDRQSHIAEFGDNLPNLTPAQHLMLCIELPLLMNELSTEYSPPYGTKCSTMLEMAGELGIDADAMRKEVSAEVKSAAKAKAKPAAKPTAKPETKPAAKKPAKTAPVAAPAAPVTSPVASWPFPVPRAAEKTASTPTPAAQAQELSAPGKTEAAQAQGSSAAGKTKRKAAAAA